MKLFISYFVNNNYEQTCVGVGKLTARLSVHTLKRFIRRLVFVDIKN